MRRTIMGALLGLAAVVLIALVRLTAREQPSDEPADRVDSAPPPAPAATPALAAPSAPDAPHEPARDTTLVRLEREYTAAVQAKDIGALVALDREVAALVRRLTAALRQADARSDDASPAFEARSDLLGVRRSGFDAGEGVYDGRILRAAHVLDPHSAWRAHTLWSQVFAEDTYGPPDLAVVRQYLRELPDGPFAGAAASAAGTLYHDLFMTLRDTTGSGSLCVGHLITSAPRPRQIALARDSALKYLDLALRRAPGGGPREARRRVAEGEEPGTWYHCPD